MKKYWKSTEELSEMVQQNSPVRTGEQEPEFSVEGLDEAEIKQGLKSNRRDFLKMLGFSVGFASLATSCETPVRKAIPYLTKPEEVTPGIANHYASTYFDGHDYASLVVKVREGRPIKIEGNELSSITQGGTSARIQASVLSLYDGNRQQFPLKNGEHSDYSTIDKDVKTKLGEIAAKGGKTVILSSTVISPSTKQLFEAFKEKYPGSEVVYYDAISYSAMKKANKETFGKKTLPAYHFDNAEIIVGFNCDFLGTWLSPIEFSAQYAKTRDLTNGNKKMSKHYQFESYLSLTGSNADVRYPIKPSEEKTVLLNLYNYIAGKSSMDILKAGKSPVDISKLADELMSHPSKSLIVSGTNDVSIQVLVNGINFLLANLGGTLEFERNLQIKNGCDHAFANLVNEMNEGKVDALIMYNVNPGYDYVDAEKFINGMKKTGLTVSLSSKNDETAKHANYVCPDNHYLESWNDAEPYNNLYSIAQPTIHNIFDTRQAQESLMAWAGIEGNYHDFIQKYWEENLFGKQSEYLLFTDFWNNSVQKGIFETDAETIECPLFDFDYFNRAGADFTKVKAGGDIELVLYESIAIGPGIMANNPWLQELPDPMSKAVWDNYVAVSPRFAKDKGWEQEDVVKVNASIELPILIQPGQPYGTVSIALGYGRTDCGKVGNGIGKNAFGLGETNGDLRSYSNLSATIEKTGETYPLATTQTHHDMKGREIVKETTIAEYAMNQAAGNESHKLTMDKSETMYPEYEFPGAHWGLAVDFNKCTGCNACVVGCQAENNVAVIGKEEVKNRRIMHWIRIDRYFSTETDEINSPVVSENPEVLHQPVMCQQCDNAPCENVCPVAAVLHTKEGLNAMVYNRCIGTRYCMNNCPYRVRRFNWYRYLDNDKFDYNFNDDISKMVLNPDVVVRERGVNEKCTFCVQRIQEKKLVAKDENRPLRDGEIIPACVQACPTKALTFGDTNLKGSELNKKFEDQRAYGLLEDLHTVPSVQYLTKVRNKDAGHQGEKHHS
ncbi:MAG: 4Fe-4S dicluster domain-containing protein [Chlorobi bacterium]|nr:4Fe-4S dicluster domain-containing protein [Chlorobiota bacterium]